MRAAPITILAALLALGACQRAADPDATPSQTGAADATSAPGPEAKPGTAITQARVVLPAVKGRPGVLYFTVANGGTRPVMIAAIHVDGVERAEAHETAGGTMKAMGVVTVPAGASVTFAPGGRHVMLFTLSPSLVAGGHTEVTLSFGDGDKLSAPASVVAAGGGHAAGGMAM